MKVRFDPRQSDTVAGMVEITGRPFIEMIVPISISYADIQAKYVTYGRVFPVCFIGYALSDVRPVVVMPRMNNEVHTTLRYDQVATLWIWRKVNVE
jgi:hypothetical protein